MPRPALLLAALAAALAALAAAAPLPAAAPLGRHSPPDRVHDCIMRARQRLGDAGGAGARPALASLRARGDNLLTLHRRNAHLAATECGFNRTLAYNPKGCGLGDRVRGAVTTFYLALVTHSTFALDWDAPFKLDDYFDVGRFVVPFRPADADWVGAINDWAFFTSAAYIDRLASSTAPVVILNTNSFHWKEVVAHPAHLRAAQSYGIAGATRHDLYRLAFDAVFGSPRQHVMDELRRTLGDGGGVAAAGGLALAAAAASSPRPRRAAGLALARRKQPPPVFRVPIGGAGLLVDAAPRTFLIGIQLRTGGVGEAWEETAFHRHPLTSVACFAREAAALCRQQAGGGCRVFLTADSAAAAARFRDDFKVAAAAGDDGSLGPVAADIVEAAGLTLHADMPVPAGARAAPHPYTKTFVDWLALSTADAVLMSHSGFGWTAAWGGGVPYARQLKWERGRAPEACDWLPFDACATMDNFL